MRAHQAQHPVVTLCRVLGVSPSGYYAWRQRPASARATADAALSAQIDAIHARSRRTYGERRVHAELRESNVHVSRRRIAQLMRAMGLAGVSRRKRTTTTVRDRDLRPAPDLVDRNFSAAGPDRLWVADITYHPDVGGLSLSRRRPRCVESSRGRVGDGDAPTHRAGARRAQYGARPTPAHRRHPPFRSRLSVYVVRLRATL